MWAAIFPGQGSQTVGMGRFLYDNFTTARLLFEEASDVLSQDMKKLCFEGPDSELTLTKNTQPALVLVSTVTERVLREVRPITFIAGSGHSVGEYSALVAASSLTLADALKAVRLRGQWMQEAVPVGEGGMLAVMGLGDELVENMCAWAQQSSGLSPLEPANFNAPGQVVVSGSQKLIDWLRANFKAEQLDPSAGKVRLIPLKVSAPFHCRLMKPAEEKMAIALREVQFTDAYWPVVQNFTAEAVTEAELLRVNLTKQISGAVRWVQCVQKLKALGAKKLIELGSGKVLAGLVKKIDSGALQTFNIQSLDELREFERTKDLP